MAEKRDTILVIRLSALGDVAMTLPVIYSLARRYPQLDVAVVTRPFFGKIFIGAPANVRIVAVDSKEYRGVRGTWRLLRRLRDERPALVADLHNVLRSWIIDARMRLAGVKVRMLSKQRRSRKHLYGASGETQKPYIERYCDVFRRLGYPVTPDFRSLYEYTGIPESPVKVRPDAVGIAPFARYATKIYPEDQMIQVIRDLTARGYAVYLFGAPGDEAEKLDRWAAEIPGCESVAGRFPIADELALMARMRLMVTMDSSNQHLAALTGTRVLSIWGSTTPACGFLGYGQRPDRALVAGVKCQPCSVAGLPECPLGSDECMKALTPRRVVERIMSLCPPGAL